MACGGRCHARGRHGVTRRMPLGGRCCGLRWCRLRRRRMDGLVSWRCLGHRLCRPAGCLGGGFRWLGSRLVSRCGSLFGDLRRGCLADRGLLRCHFLRRHLLCHRLFHGCRLPGSLGSSLAPGGRRGLFCRRLADNSFLGNGRLRHGLAARSSLFRRDAGPHRLGCCLGLALSYVFRLARCLRLLRFGGGRTTCRFRHIPSPILAVAARCYSLCISHRQPRVWNTCNTTCHKRCWQRESHDSIDTALARVLQALAESAAGPALPIPSQLLRLCTDRGRALRSVARRPVDQLAPVALPAAMRRWQRPGARALPLRPLPPTRRF